jgi:dTDP-glucose 4,6-dehydratase
LGSLHPTRDFTFVHDTVSGFVRAGEAEGIVGGVFNLGTGRETSIDDLARVIGELLGRALKVEVEEERVRPAASEVDRLIADATYARDVLDWRPSVSLEDGLAQTIEWLRAHRDLYRPEVYAI